MYKGVYLTFSKREEQQQPTYKPRGLYKIHCAATYGRTHKTSLWGWAASVKESQQERHLALYDKHVLQ